MDKLIDAFTALPTAAQVTVSICIVVGAVAISIAFLVCMTKMLIALFRVGKSVPIAAALSAGVATSIGLGVTGQAVCLWGLMFMVLSVLIYEMSYFFRFDSLRGNSIEFDPR